MKILVVDDQPGVRLTLAAILKRRGYEVAVAEDGYGAIEEIKKNGIDVAILDIKMPGMDGVETFVKIKQINPNILVFMMTAFAVEDQIKRAIEEGAKGIVYKPFDVDEVLAMIGGCAKFPSHPEQPAF